VRQRLYAIGCGYPDANDALRWTRGIRYFRAHLEQDLWSSWVVTHVNGRLSSPMGRARSLPAATIESTLLQLAAIAKRRRERAYTLTTRP
jgi:hypothetical protein